MAAEFYAGLDLLVCQCLESTWSKEIEEGLWVQELEPDLEEQRENVDAQ